MPDTIQTGAVHHLRLTVTDVARSREFYTSLLGFRVLMEMGPSVLLHNGSILLGMGPAPNNPLENDRFDENRVGLVHLSFSVSGREALEDAARLLDERGVPNGGVKDLGKDFGLYILAFRDPDNIQLELTATYS